MDKHPPARELRSTPSPKPELSAASAWRFSVRCPRAEQVMLVTEDASGLSSWVPMRAATDGLGTWELDLADDGIAGPVRYYTVEAGSVLNCGTAGLSATRVPARASSGRALAATA